MTKTELVIISIFILLPSLVLVIAEKKRETGKIHIYDAPVVTNWCDEGTFVVEEPIKKIGETGLRRIIIRRVDGGRGDLFYAILDPEYTHINCGSIVKIKQVEYMHDPYTTFTFMVAVKHSP